MKQYGYINENGYLVAYDSEILGGNLENCLKAGWKPVDEVDDSRRECEDGYIVVLRPYDAGDHIAFEYKTIVDRQAKRKEIADLKANLDGSDYKVIKCYEASLLGEELPYNIAELHRERQEIRNRINGLEEEISRL